MPNPNDPTPEAARARQKIEQAREDSRAREIIFLNAWKRGVKLAGPHYFKNTLPTPGAGPLADVENATSKWQLCPDLQMIRRAIGGVSRGEGAFLAAMYSFYNAKDGQQLLKRAGYPNICDLAAKLDSRRAGIIAELFLNYPGW